MLFAVLASHEIKNVLDYISTRSRLEVLNLYYSKVPYSQGYFFKDCLHRCETNTNTSILFSNYFVWYCLVTHILQNILLKTV